MPITRINEFHSAAGKSAELFDFLKSLVPYISSSEGCHSCEVLQSSDDDNRFVVIEKWDSENAHKKSLENYPKEKMAAVMPLIGEPPTGSFYHK